MSHQSQALKSVVCVCVDDVSVVDVRTFAWEGAGAYALVFGWPYAAGMVGLIAVHEAGHALVLRKEGIPYGPMVFMPFMGAVIEMRGRPRNAYVEAKASQRVAHRMGLRCPQSYSQECTLESIIVSAYQGSREGVWRCECGESLGMCKARGACFPMLLEQSLRHFCCETLGV